MLAGAASIQTSDQSHLCLEMGKGGAAKAKGEKATGGKTKSANAGLTFRVSRAGRLLKSGNFAKRVGGAARLYLAAEL